MRRLLLVVVTGLGLVVALAAPALADAPVVAPPAAAPAAAPATDPYGPPAPGHRMRQPEILHEKPSGFRLPNVRAKDGAYNYPLMGIGAGVLAITAFLTIRYLRKISRERG